MKPVKFKGYNIEMGKGQPEYLPLPAFKEREPQGRVISCWRLSFLERIRVLFFGRVYVSSMTFHNPLQPLHLTTESPIIFSKPSK